MNKLKAIAATVLAASAIGVGGLVAAPTASAMPPRCMELSTKSIAYYNAGMVLEAYGEMAVDCFRGL